MIPQKAVHIAVVGATGVVGEEMLAILAERGYALDRITALASARSAGRRMPFGSGQVEVKRLTADAFARIELALFSAGEAVSREFAPLAVDAGAVVVDNSSAFRMEANVPLVVPEVNGEAAHSHAGIIANPNCSTIQMVMALAPIHRAVGIRRVVVCTYQSVSGKGRRAMMELQAQSEALATGNEPPVDVFPHRMAFNLIPDWGTFDAAGNTGEEIKMSQETVKILNDPSVQVSATTVRVPVMRAHCEAIHLETRQPIGADAVRRLLAATPGVSVQEDTGYITPLEAEGRDEVFVGRIREDPTVPNGLALWVVSDNLRKGAALNAVQIAEILFNRV